MIKKTLVINGVTRKLVLDGSETLATVLREHLLLTGCKIGCGEGHCGACNVIVNGKVTKACITKMSRIAEGAEITTIEGIGTMADMHPLQVAWMAYGCAQCGFCSPGFIISAKVLLEQNPNPTRVEVRDWFNKQRNLCRCTGYKPLIDATMAAAMTGEGTSYADLAKGAVLTEEEYGVAFRKGSDLCAELNKFMDKIIADGTFKALGDKYELSVVTE